MKLKILVMTILLMAAFGCVPANAKVVRKAKSVQEILDEQEKALRRILDHIKEERARREFEEKEIGLLAEGGYWENWHTDKEKLTVRWTMAVIMNRVRSKEYPDTVESVLYQRGQYSTTKYFYTKKLPDEAYEMARDVYYNGTPDVPKNVIYQAQFYQGKGVWQKKNGEYFCYG